MLIGIYGIIFEFWNPGFVLPGVVGAISLLLALYAFQVLPVNYAGLALIALGIAMMVGEMLMPSFGALGFGGVVAFVVGSIMLMDTDAPGFGISWQLVGGVALAASASLLLLMAVLARSHRGPVITGQEEMLGSRATVIDWQDGDGPGPGARGDLARPRARRSGRRTGGPGDRDRWPHARGRHARLREFAHAIRARECALGDPRRRPAADHDVGAAHHARVRARRGVPARGGSGRSRGRA